MERLVLWDIDRTLLYVGELDRQVYREVFTDLLGRPPERLPAKGTGLTVPLAVRELFVNNGVSTGEVDGLVRQALAVIPERFAAHRHTVRRVGMLLPGAVDSLRAVASLPGTVATVVTGNLRPNAEVKLTAFGLDKYVEPLLGGYSSDDAYRPALVRIAQQRAAARYRVSFDRRNTVVIGDSTQDVVTGRTGGAGVIGVASGTTSADELLAAGADLVLPDLRDADAVVRAVLELTGPGDAARRHG